MQLLNKNALSTLFTRAEQMIDLQLPPVTILGYHAVSHEKTIVDVEPEMLQKQLSILKDLCQFVTLDQVVLYIQGKKTFTKPAVALTFDDGYKDIFTTVMPILAKEKIVATAFVLSNPESANRKELENNKPFLTTKELQILHTMGWAIGCHSATHANFADIQLNRQKEIVDAKEQLENDLGLSVRYFAYPKGIYSPHIVETVKSAGFAAAFAFESGFISQKTNLFTIPRMAVDWTHSEEQFRAFFTHWGIWYLQTKQRVERSFRFI